MSLTPDEQRGYDKAIDRVLQLCTQQAETYARTRKELQDRKRESLPFHYRALAIIDFRLLIEDMANRTSKGEI